MKSIDLNGLSDADIQKLIEDGQELLKARAKQRREEALEAAKAALAGAGLTPQDLIAATRKRSTGAAALPSGQKFVNPDNPKQTWTSGRGRRPTWFQALERAGRIPAPAKV